MGRKEVIEVMPDKDIHELASSLATAILFIGALIWAVFPDFKWWSLLIVPGVILGILVILFILYALIVFIIRLFFD